MIPQRRSVVICRWYIPIATNYNITSFKKLYFKNIFTNRKLCINTIAVCFSLQKTQSHRNIITKSLKTGRLCVSWLFCVPYFKKSASCLIGQVTADG